MNRTTAESAAAALNTAPNLPATWTTEHTGGGTWTVVYTAPDGRTFTLSSDWPNDRTVVEYPSLAAWRGETPTLDDPTLHTVTTYGDVIDVVTAEWPCNLCPAVAGSEARLGEHYDVDHADDAGTPLAPAATVTAERVENLLADLANEPARSHERIVRQFLADAHITITD